MNQASVLKGVVHPKMNILSSFSHPHVVPNLHDLTSAEKSQCLFNGNQTWLAANIPQNIFFCVPQEGLEQHEGEQMMTETSFLGELSL